MKNIVSGYYDWLKDNTFLHQINDNTVRVSLPFLNRNNDYSEIFIVKQSDGQYLLTDDGETVSELEFSGFSFTKKKKEFLQKILSLFGMSFGDGNSIYTKADCNDLYIKKHLLVQCMTKVSDMFSSANQSDKSSFSEKVEEFLYDNGVRFSCDITFIGRSRLPCQFDFLIPSSKSAPERVIKAINNLGNDTAKLLIFNWGDALPNRKPDSRLFAFINNADKDIRQDAFASFAEYDISAVEWSRRSGVIKELLA